MSIFAKFLISLICIVVCGWAAYHITKEYLRVIDFEERFDELKTILKYKKKYIKMLHSGETSDK
jgi:hypothetical protein